MIMPRFLIAGLGSAGKRHLSSLLSLGLRDILLLRTRPEPIREAPDLPVFTRLEDALAARPDLVVVSTPTSAHLEVAVPAAEAGCHLLIEKPLSHTWQGVENLLAIARRRRIVGLVGFDLRFDPGLRRIKTLLAAGTIGRITSLQAAVGQYLPDWHPWEDYRRGVSARIETGGGVLLDLIHELDYVPWLVGPVTEIACLSGKVSRLEIETEDTAEILLRFENGAIGSLHLDYVQRAPHRSCRLIGEEGTIVWDYFAQTVTWYTAACGQWQSFAYPDHQRNDRFLAEVTHFLACVEGREQPETDLATGSRSLQLVLAAKESSRLKKVVTL